MRINKRRVKILIKNIMQIPFRLKNNVSLTALLQESTLGKNIIIGGRVKFYRSQLGDHSYVQSGSFVCDCEIGKYTSISQNCYIGGAAHPLDWVGTSIRFYCTQKHEEGNAGGFYKRYFDPFVKTHIGNDVWIGANVMIKAGVSVADGAVIGMGAVVTKDIGPYEIWAGNPARFIRKRFPDEICTELLGSKWWELDDSKVSDLSVYMNEPGKFIEEVNKL